MFIQIQQVIQDLHSPFYYCNFKYKHFTKILKICNEKNKYKLKEAQVSYPNLF